MSRSRTLPAATRPKRLPLTGVLRLGRLNDTWFKPASGVTSASLVPLITLYALGRLDLAAYTMAGSMCALYGHNLPYAARSRAVLWVILGMTGSVALAMVTSALTDSVPVLIAVGAVLVALQKTVCEASRIGPPGPVVFAFISSATLFVPQTFGSVPGHLALTLGAAALAWCVTMAPGLVRPNGPERRATARALEAAAAAVAAPGPGPAADGARAAAAAGVHTAWQTLYAARRRTPERRALERLVVRAEVALAAPGDSDPEALRRIASQVRGTRPLPRPEGLDDRALAELAGIDIERARAPRSQHPVLRAFAPGSTLLPVALRTLTGSALAGYVAHALGSDRPYWAIVTAVSLYQSNLTLSWNRAVQRVVGNLVGVGVFAALSPLPRAASVWLVVLVLVLSFGAEACMPRNYWLGSCCVTPMALLISEFSQFHGAGELIGDRVLDTVLGAAVGILAALAVTNRRAGAHLEHALATADRTRAEAAVLLARPEAGASALESARRRLGAALVELRGAADAAAGEWWQRALPEQQVLDVERAGHRTLAATVERQGLVAVRAPERRPAEKDVAREDAAV
ncbi:FUSC family protein [Streptomyces sp. NPDC049954]|uniref:FUSC family protein n=1 Tax=Streptomyces sp. NPDC049954 TaxID=3155779 RepID=UPI0034331E35